MKKKKVLKSLQKPRKKYHAGSHNQEGGEGSGNASFWIPHNPNTADHSKKTSQDTRKVPDRGSSSTTSSTSYGSTSGTSSTSSTSGGDTTLNEKGKRLERTATRAEEIAKGNLDNLDDAVTIADPEKIDDAIETSDKDITKIATSTGAKEGEVTTTGSMTPGTLAATTSSAKAVPKSITSTKKVTTAKAGDLDATSAATGTDPDKATVTLLMQKLQKLKEQQLHLMSKQLQLQQQLMQQQPQ